MDELAPGFLGEFLSLSKLKSSDFKESKFLLILRNHACLACLIKEERERERRAEMGGRERQSHYDLPCRRASIGSCR